MCCSELEIVYILYQLYVCLEDAVSQVVVGVQSWVRVHKGYLHQSLGFYPAGTESPGMEWDRLNLKILDFFEG